MCLVDAIPVRQSCASIDRQNSTVLVKKIICLFIAQAQFFCSFVLTYCWTEEKKNQE